MVGAFIYDHLRTPRGRGQGNGAWHQIAQVQLARALDLVAPLRKTPLVVNESRGWSTSRLIGTCNELFHRPMALAE